MCAYTANDKDDNNKGPDTQQKNPVSSYMVPHWVPLEKTEFICQFLVGP